MAGEFSLSSGFTLAGGRLAESVPVKKFSGLTMDVEVSPNIIGNLANSNRQLGSLAGPVKFGQPTFVCPIPKGDMTLANWWTDSNPNARQGNYIPQDLIFSYMGPNNEVHAEWQLKGVLPMKYEVSDADDSNADIIAETIQLAVTEIVRMR